MIHLKILDFQKNIDYFKDELTNFDKFSKVIEASIINHLIILR